MQIRKFKPEDQEEKKKVHKKAIRGIASEDYSEKQIKAWSDFSDYGGIEEEVKRWVAVEDDKIIGFSDYRPNESRVTGVYVHPDYTGQGIGSKLLEKVLEDAENQGLVKLNSESSITAKEFYQKHGFELVEEVEHETNGVQMKAFEMKRKL